MPHVLKDLHKGRASLSQAIAVSNSPSRPLVTSIGIYETVWMILFYFRLFDVTIINCDLQR